jgi:hypothetical protein
MQPNPIDKIREKETAERSYRWYQDIIRKVGLASFSAQRVMQTDIGEFVSNVEMGDMYLFFYDPKTKETLPYYDTVPLVVTFKKVKGGFLGLNLHYLSPMLRMKLLGRLLEVTNDTTLSETTKFRLRWNLLDNATRFPGVHACVKRYLKSHINSRMLKINPKDWKKAIILPIDNFEKESRQTVFNRSRKYL